MLAKLFVMLLTFVAFLCMLFLMCIVVSDHCSAMIKLTTDMKELFFAHTTWSSFALMLRVYKRYTLYTDLVPGSTVHFSSYPGFLDSMDDYYSMTPSLLSSMETTIDTYNGTLFDLNSPSKKLILYFTTPLQLFALTTAGA